MTWPNVPVPASHLDPNDRRTGRDTDGANGVVSRRDDPGHEGGVGESVGITVFVEGKSGNERSRVHYINVAVEVDVRVVEPAVDDSNPHPGSPGSCVPCFGRVYRSKRPLEEEKTLVVANARAGGIGALRGVVGFPNLLVRVDPAHHLVQRHGLDAGNAGGFALELSRRRGRDGDADLAGCGGQRTPRLADPARKVRGQFIALAEDEK
jgi:hypothetical protein